MSKKNNMVYLINNEEEVATIAEVCEILGVKVTKKQILAGEVDGVEYVESALDDVAANVEDDKDDELIHDIEGALDDKEDDTEEVEEEVAPQDTNTTEDTEEVYEHPQDTHNTEDTDSKDTDTQDTGKADYTKEDLSKMSLADKLKLITKPSQPKASKKVEKYDADKEIDFPEVGYFKTKDELKEFYKPLQDSHLDQWVELEGLTWKECGNPGIDRMRRCMAITNLHFPSQSKAKKSKSKYAQYSTERLVEMCLENDVELADAKGNLKILRMYAIMALRKEGIIE